MKIAIQCSSIGQRCGIYTYAKRLSHYLSKLPNVKTLMFAENLREDVDVISVQYEPGIVPPQLLNRFINQYVNPVIVVTAHHINGLQQFFPILEGVVLHSESQIKGLREEPWNYRVIPHPALVFPKQDKIKLREKYGLPVDKKIVGTAGFITGTGKRLPLIVEKLLPKLNDDEFLYLITSYWKAGDLGREAEIRSVVKRLGKEENFRIDTEFVPEKILNEKMQACDLLFAWNAGGNSYGSQSGIAADMYGSYTKLIVKDVPHYDFIGSQEGVLKGRPDPDKFTDDVVHALRHEDLDDVPDPTWLSWENQVKNYLEYFEELAMV